MKAIILFAVFSICSLGVSAQYQSDTIYPIVYGNQVSIHQDNAHRNCGFQPGLKHITIDDSIIKWYQVDTIGIFYGCLCFFDYSVTIDSLNPGSYTALVYSVYHTPDWSDTTYEGITTFTIIGQPECDSIVQLSSFASACHEYDGLKENRPLGLKYTIICNANGISINSKGTGRINRVAISNLSGQEVFRKIVEPAPVIQLQTPMLNKGIYIISVSDNHGVTENQKIVVF